VSQNRERSVSIERCHIGHRLNQAAEGDDLGIGAPDAGKVERETRRVAEAEDIPILQARLFLQQLWEQSPRRLGVATEPMDQDNRRPCAGATMIDPVRTVCHVEP